MGCAAPGEEEEEEVNTSRQLFKCSIQQLVRLLAQEATALIRIPEVCISYLDQDTEYPEEFLIPHSTQEKYWISSRGPVLIFPMHY